VGAGGFVFVRPRLAPGSAEAWQKRYLALIVYKANAGRERRRFIRVVSHPTLLDHTILEITRDGRDLLRVAAVADCEARLQRRSLQGRVRSDPGM
jgi:hypothetical protein